MPDLGSVWLLALTTSFALLFSAYFLAELFDLRVLWLRRIVVAAGFSTAAILCAASGLHVVAADDLTASAKAAIGTACR
jgi:hypothetical protein